MIKHATPDLPPPEAELEPHAYVPSIMHMGDCAVCGHLQGAPIHSPFRDPKAALAGKEDQMDVNSKEAELWSETMRLKSSVEHKDAEIERLRYIVRNNAYRMGYQEAYVDRVLDVWDKEARAALAGKEG